MRASTVYQPSDYAGNAALKRLNGRLCCRDFARLTVAGHAGYPDGFCLFINLTSYLSAYYKVVRLIRWLQFSLDEDLRRPFVHILFGALQTGKTGKSTLLSYPPPGAVAPLQPG